MDNKTKIHSHERQMEDSRKCAAINPSVRQTGVKSLKITPLKIKCTKCKKLVNELPELEIRVGRPKQSVSYINCKPHCNLCYCKERGWLRDKLIRQEALHQRFGGGKW